MAQFEQHLNAVQQEMQLLSNNLHNSKDKLEQAKQEGASQTRDMQNLFEQHQRNQMELAKHQKMLDKYYAWISQYQSSLPREAQGQLSNEVEQIKQSLQQHDPQQMAASNMMNMAAMGGMGPPGLSMMLAQAQAQAQAAQARAAGMMTGMAAPSPRLPKANGIPNGIPGLPPNMNGIAAAQMAAMQNPMAMAAAAGMPAAQMAQMAQAAQAAMFGGMGMAGIQFNQAQQLAAMQSMGMNGMMLPPMSAANSALAGQMMSQMGLSVSTPSRNPSNGPLSGTRTPQSTNGVNSPRTYKEEPAEVKREPSEVISPASEDTVAVA